MIEQITGFIVEKKPNKLVLDVHGIGFGIDISSSTYDDLGLKGEEITLYTRLIHRDDAMELYGFSTLFERDLFDCLCTASGIGPKMSGRILSGMKAQDIAVAISSRDYKTLTTIQGLGKKRAERLCVELESTVSDMPIPEVGSMENNAKDAMDALVELGFNRYDVQKAVRSIVKEDNSISTEEIIRFALENLRK